MFKKWNPFVLTCMLIFICLRGRDSDRESLISLLNLKTQEKFILNKNKIILTHIHLSLLNN